MKVILALLTSVVTAAAPGVPSATPTPSPTGSAAPGFVAHQGTQFSLDGSPWRFTGVNAYELATFWGINAGCGPMLTDVQMESFFASLRPGSAVRFWAFQGLATNATTKQRDWRPIDRVVEAATRHRQKLIMALSGQGGGCDDGHWKDVAWYNGGYRRAFDDDGKGIAPAPYWSYLHDVAARYATSTVVALWELVSEPEAKPSPAGPCNQAAARRALRSFFDTVGGELHRIDSNHLIGSGALGSGQCGTSGMDYQYVHQSPGIDVASYHDYGADSTPVPGDRWNGLQARLNEMRIAGKPLIVGEVGMKAQHNLAGCMALLARSDHVRAKMTGQFSAGVSGFLLWDWVPSDEGGCTYENITAGDPLLGMLHDYQSQPPAQG
jgi:mannan endo-1,4-beta-mannosidase